LVSARRVKKLSLEPVDGPVEPDENLGFDGQDELVLAQLVSEVLARNPSVQAMIAAWQAAAARYPQVVSLDDPMFNSMLAPASFASNSVDAGYVLGISQKIPWKGKRPLRGQIARAEASSAWQDVADTRLELAEAAQLAFYDYYQSHRQLELNATNLERLHDFREIARGKYEASLVLEQDVLQADVELADLERRRVELERMERVAKARINTLLHRAPDFPLPPPPAELEPPSEPAAVEALRQWAIERRPDLASLRARIRAEQAAVSLACKDYYPDIEIMGRYDSFWQPGNQRDLRPQLGLNLNVPLNNDRRRAAVREAAAKLRQRRAEYDGRIDDINRQVQSSFDRLEESRRIVELYQEQILPAAEQNVESASAAYESSKGDFLRLIAAQRQRIMLSEKYQEAVADLHRRRAELERVVGGPLNEVEPAEEIPPGER
jgi:outer membrane protein TolC